MNKNMLAGFRTEMEKQAISLEEGVKGLGVGAIMGAILAAMGAKALERLVVRNKDAAILAGAIMGAGTMGSAGYLLGQPKQNVTNVTPPPAPPAGVVIHGAPPAGTPISSMRHI